MTKQKEITATEKLLDLIRKEGPESKPAETPPEKRPPAADARSSVPAESKPELVMEGGQANAAPTSAEEQSTPAPPEGPSAAVELPGPSDSPIQDHPAVTETETQPAQHGEQTFSFAPGSRKEGLAANLLDKFTTIKLGVDIQPGSINLVKIQVSANKRKFLASQSVAYDMPQSSHDKEMYADPAFRGLLSQTLSAFCDRSLEPETWCSYAYCHPVGIYNITIPMVPEKEIANAIFWSAKREIDFDEKQNVFDFTVFKEFKLGDQDKMMALVTIVPKREVKGVEALFKGVGYPLTGLTFPASAVQNYLQFSQSETSTEPVVYFTIRNKNSFIDLFYQGKMLFSREIKTGSDSFVEAILDQAAQKDIFLDEENAKNYIFRPLTAGKPGKKPKISQEIADQLAIQDLPVIERLVRQLMRTFEYCSTNFKIPRVSRLYTAGISVLNNDILTIIEKRLDVSCSIIDPLSSKIFSFEKAPNVPIGTSILNAAGLTLSDKAKTKNFLYTFSDREKDRQSRKINKVIAITTIIMALLCAVFFFIEYRSVSAQKAMVRDLSSKLESKYQADPRSKSADFALAAMQKIKSINLAAKKMVQRFMVPAIISELGREVPEEIKLTDFSLVVDYQTENSGKDKPKKRVSGRHNDLEIKGLVTAAPEQQEIILLNLMKRLTRLSLIENPVLQEKEPGRLSGRDILKFKLRARVKADLIAETTAPEMNGQK